MHSVEGKYTSCFKKEPLVAASPVAMGCWRWRSGLEGYDQNQGPKDSKYLRLRGRYSSTFPQNN